MIIFGKNSVHEYLETKKPILKAFLMDSGNVDFSSRFKQLQIPIEIVSKQEMNRRFEGNHQGVAVEIPDYPTYTLQDLLANKRPGKYQLIVLLDGIEDPHNLGAIIRSAEAAGCDGIVIPKHRSVGITPTVVKVASGAIEHIKVATVTNINQTIEQLKKQGFWVVGTSLDATKSYTEIDVSCDLAIVIGAEGKGMAKLVKETVDYNVTIPMKGKANSLNASVSAGILLFDIIRRRTN